MKDFRVGEGKSAEDKCEGSRKESIQDLKTHEDILSEQTYKRKHDGWDNLTHSKDRLPVRQQTHHFFHLFSKIAVVKREVALK